jgi:uncharacterized protein (TIGR02302 family)
MTDRSGAHSRRNAIAGDTPPVAGRMRADRGTDGNGRRLGLRLAQARWTLFWEHLWPALWPPVGIVGLFALFLLFDIGPLLPGWLHALALAGFAAGIAIALWRGLWRIRMPDERAAGRRIETATALAHRPITTREDRMVGGFGDRGSAALWEAHRRQREAALASLRVGLPKAGLAKYDPLGLRAALVLLLVIGIFAARDDFAARIARGLLPDFSATAATTPVAYDIWITPPAYTRLAPVLLSTNSAPETQPTSLSVPEGSALIAQLSGGDGEPAIAVGDIETAFTAIDGATWRLETSVLTGDALRILQDGEAIASWPMTVVPDLPPEIDFGAKPSATERYALRLDYRARDDYGIASVMVEIKRADGRTGPGDIAAIGFGLPLPALDQKEVAAFGFSDLTAHPWAGLPVEIRLEARDAAGQRGASEAFAMVLPERPFRHPIARAIVEQRRRLIVEAEDAVSEVADKLLRLSARTEMYDEDPIVTLALVTAGRRLMLSAGDEATLPEVVKLLWSTALRVEEGELALVEQRLRELQKELQEALANNAPDEEIRRLMDELRETLDEFVNALAERIQRDFENGFIPQPLNQDSMELTRDDLQNLVDQAEQLSESGAREAAQNLLAELQQILENLRANPMLAQPEDASNEAVQMMRDMESLIRRQQNLLDRTFRESQQPLPEDGSRDLGEQAVEQDELRYDLGDLMRRLAEMTGDIPENLGNAEQEMRGSHQALTQGDANASADAQVRVLDELQQGARQMRSQLRDQLVRRPGGGPMDMMEGENRDPFGREEGTGAIIDTSDVAIPEEADLQRSREILDELRRRGADRSRPELELDYIDRLLRQF